MELQAMTALLMRNGRMRIQIRREMRSGNQNLRMNKTQ
jgi:hypothetical protein